MKRYFSKLYCLLLMLCLFGNKSNSQIITLFSENFSSNSFATNGWTFPNGQGNWLLGSSNTPQGAVAPNAFFNWAVATNNYSCALLSNTINATSINGPVLIDYLLLFNPYSTATLEQFKIEYKTTSSNTWTLLTNYTNSLTSITNWSVTNVNLPGLSGQNFQIKFTAYGVYSFNITRWSLDNIVVKGTNCLNSLPALTITATPTICAGSSATLTAYGGGTSYTWTPFAGGNGSVAIVSPTVTTTYAAISSIPGCAVTPVTAVSTITVVTNTSSLVASSSSSVICSGNSVTLTASGVSTYSWDNGATTYSTVVSPTVSTTYSVINTNSLGCSLTKTVTVNVNPNPTLLVYSTNSLICIGNSNNFIVTGASSYTWSNGSNSSIITVTPQTSTIYSVTGMDAQGCSSSNTINVAVSPQVNIVASNSAICTGQSTTLSANSALSYTWNNSSTSNSIIVSPVANTSYSVIATDNIGCVTSRSITISVNPNPTVTIISSSPTVCLGSTATLTAGGASTYTWNNSFSGLTHTVMPSINSSYSVSGTSVFGCMGPNSSATIAILTVPLPTLSVISSSSVICSGLTLSLSAAGASSYSWSFGATGITATTSATGNTTYSVIGTSAQLCSSTATVNVNVLPSPTLAITINSTNICIGSTATVSASGAQSYSWSTGSTANTINTTPQSTAIYTVSGIGNNNCITTNTFQIIVSNYPSLIVNGSNSLICSGESTSLFAQGALSYLWSTGSTGSVVIVSPQVTTTYTVEGSNNGCVSTTTLIQLVDLCTGIRSLKEQEPFYLVYPNPSNGIYFIELISKNENTSVNVISTLGEFSFSQKLIIGTNTLDLKEFKNGLYYLEIINDKELKTQKIIKQ